MANYVTVPMAPGVPPVLRAPGVAIPVAPALLVADALDVLNSLAGPQWGVFDDSGAPVIVGDSCRSFEWRGDAHVSTYPQEQGAFASYNKVSRPQEVRLTFLVGQSVANRAEFLDETMGVLGSLDLYTAVSPEASYQNVNVTHVEYHRDRETARLMSVDVWLEEIVVTGTATFSNTEQPDGADPVNAGTVQPQQATASGSTINVAGGSTPAAGTSAGAGAGTGAGGATEEGGNSDSSNLVGIYNAQGYMVGATTKGFDTGPLPAGQTYGPYVTGGALAPH